MKKILLFLIIALTALAIVIVAGRDLLIKTVMEKAVTGLTGFETTVQDVKYTFPATIRIQGLVIRNPKDRGFEQEIFVSIPEIYAALVLQEILKKERVHLTEVRLNIEQVSIEKNPEGVSNVELLSSAAPKSETPAPSPRKEAALLPFQLDQFHLTLRRVSFDDYSSVAGLSVPKKVAVDMNVQGEVFYNITDPKALVNLILMKIVYGTTFGKLLNLNPEALLNENLKSVMDSGSQLLSGTADAVTVQAEQALSQMAGQSRELLNTGAVSEKTGTVLNETGALVGDAASATQKQIGGLFGKLKSTVTGTEETPAENTP